MAQKRYEKKLAAILYADVVGYSRLTSEDELGTHRILIDYRDAFSTAIEAYGGEIVNYAGDAILADFPSVVDALICALVCQRDLQTRNESLPDERRLRFRVGINLGEVIIDGDEIYGNGVNVAARLEELAEPGGVSISEAVRGAVGSQVPATFDYIGEQQVKNIPEPVRTHRVRVEPGVELPPPSGKRKRSRRTAFSIAAASVVVLLVAGAAAFTYWMAPRMPDAKQVAGLPVPNKPSIAVLPFDNLTGDSEFEYFADGITEDIITNLAKFSGLFVIARHSVFAYKGKGADLAEMGRRLGVRYALEGSVQKAGNKTRITAQLVEVATGHHLWADRYDVKTGDIFDVRDGVLQKIASTLMGSDTGFLVRSERQRAMAKGADRLTAYDALMRGWEQWYRFKKESNLEARRLFEEAARRDPTYARAYSALAWTYAEAYDREWTDDYDTALELAFEMADKGHELDDTDYRSHWALGWAYLYQWEHDQARTHYERALALNQNDAELLAEMGNFLINIGEPERAIEQIKLAMRLNPLHEQWYTEYLGWAYEESAQPQEAIAVLGKIHEPEEWIRRTLAAAYAAIGEKEKAQEQVEKILESNPQFTLSDHEEYVRENFPYETEELIQRWIEALRKSGVPE